MIFVDETIVKINGDKATLVAEITAVLRRMYDKGIIEKDDLDFIIKHTTMSDEQLRKAVLNSISSLENLEEFLQMFIDEAKKREEE